MILGVGIDLAEVERIRREVARHGEVFLEEFLTPEEIAFCRAKRRPFSSYAARFAAKEALGKALGTGVQGTMSWLDIEVRPDDRGAPTLLVAGSAADTAAARGVTRIHLSLTHEGAYAAAVVVLEGGPGSTI
jgi:holo-[acyl-carrier protein] synthase